MNARQIEVVRLYYTAQEHAGWTSSVCVSADLMICRYGAKFVFLRERSFFIELLFSFSCRTIICEFLDTNSKLSKNVR